MSIDKNLFLGIDIGASSLKIALVSKEKGNRIKLLKAVCHEYTSYPVDEANQDQTALLAYFLKKFLHQEKQLRDARIGISIAGQSAFVRLVKIPVTAPAKLRQIVLYETQQQVPFPIKDVVWDFQIYDRDKKQLSVLLAAVKKELTASILNVINQFSLNVEFIDVSNLALYNCLQYFYQDLKHTLVLDCGAKTTNIIVVNQGNFWTRSLPLGGQDITDAIAKALKIDNDQAEKIKKDKAEVLLLNTGQKVSKDSQDRKVAQAITDVLTDLTNEIVKTLNFYKSQNEEEIHYQKVLITGGISRIKNVDRFFENSLALPVEKLDYFNFMTFNPDIDLQINEFLGPALGLALRGHGRSVLNINLLSQEHLQIRNFRKKIPYLITSAVCIVLLLFGMFLSSMATNRLLKDYLGKLGRQLGEYKASVSEIEKFKKSSADIKNRCKAMNQIAGSRFKAIQILNDITEAMPGIVWISSLNLDLDANSIVLQGNCGQDLNAIDLFQSEIKNNDIFSNVRIDTVGKNEKGSIDFSLTIFLKS